MLGQSDRVSQQCSDGGKNSGLNFYRGQSSNGRVCPAGFFSGQGVIEVPPTSLCSMSRGIQDATLGSKFSVEHSPRGKILAIPADDAILLKQILCPLPCFSIDDAFVLTYVQNTFVRGLPNVNRTTEQVIDRSSREYFPPPYPSGRTDPMLAPDFRFLEFLLEGRHASQS